MLRKFIENLTGVTTGSNMSVLMMTAWQMQGMRGESIVDNRVWIKKTHWPNIMPGAGEFHSNKVICCVRNPLDVFVSIMNLACTFSHSAKLPFEF